MELDARLQDKLIGTLRTELPKLRLSDAGRLDIQSMFDADRAFTAVLRGAPSRLKEKIEAYVGERPMVSLMFGTLTDELLLLSPEAKAGKSRLCELPQYSDVEALANRLLALLTALPNQYVAVVELPASISDELYKSSAPPILGRQLAIIGAWHEKQSGYPYPTSDVTEKPPQNALMSLLGIAALPTTMSASGQPTIDAQPPSRRSHLYVRLEGYINSIFSPQPLNRFTTLLKAFFGLAFGMEVLESGWKILNSDQLLINIYQSSADDFLKIEEETIGDNTSALIRKVSVSTGGRGRIVQDLQTIVHVLDMEETLPQLVLAGRWLFDSRSNGDELMGFMQLAICAEVLLGTEDGGEGVTAMLATRCAYLIASSAKERDDLVTEFKSIYKVRSKIVHRGLGTLKENERHQFRRLRTICNRVVQREIQLAIMDGPQHQQALKMAEALRSYPEPKAIQH
ncbi:MULTISPECIES: HEPN domain-containing protein [unclassified Polaromonas]|jgi:hypothetical protein|uniref:HEPN domain-containing protein n=1 Tax=unclassified Polaromonas TaxID=2638319 RepID=UPI000BC6989E|nr:MULTISPECIES: HEPN domain-containing protein [unclassified Polaromonas]OYY35062.1 MAG: hypothetical protein B7Y60_14410 [Polaromonas sp. 35-63-35]OYZ20201.1 MAG: hypothetical protein B7Y28_09780 [Polaromonas sp. 16-63-31]OYZ77956.1 MAG: hypothetical protein B7Y09_14605 [Polaromonas sp. 24-63-21]OZA49466.1 MAG: hypothetical protein B7X88_13620 [Polaromonas sp. 17-63-33]OZA87401.1 MAG: hypothetical protein B7X65_12850 [Polaromonas sp. 39-63-25]